MKVLIIEPGRTPRTETLDPAEITIPPAGIVVPASVSARQARLALLAAGLLDQVEAAVATAGGSVRIEWEYATVNERASPLLAAIAGALGLTDAQVDALFIAAAAF